MKDFVVKIVDRHGKYATYRLSAAGAQSVRSMAARRGWRVLSVAEQVSVKQRIFRTSPFSHAELSFIFSQLANMVGSGVVFVQAFRLLLHDVKGEKRRRILESAAGQMEKGVAPSEAVAQTGLFPGMVYGVLKAGERAGNLESMLELLGAYHKKAGIQRRILADALTYPAFLLVVTVMVFTAAIFFVLPVFEEMFRQMNIPLPEGTQYMLFFSHSLKTAGPGIVIAFFISAVLIGVVWNRPAARLAAETYFLSWPPLRRICLVICWQRFSQMVSMQMQCGISVLPAIEDGLSVVPSLWFRHTMAEVERQLEKGRAFSRAVQRSPIGTAYVETLLVIGETTGRYEDAFQSIADYYDWRIQSWAVVAQRLLGPTVILVVGIGIGFLVVLLVLPLLDMTSGFMVM